MYGWKDFNAAVVTGIRRRDARFRDDRPDGGLQCPIASHECGFLRWEARDYRKGTVIHGDPPLRFRSSPTYIYSNPLDNILAGEDLIAEAIARAWGKAETGRLGHENSEDALSWNVFRSLQEARSLRLAGAVLASIESQEEPRLFFWGREIFADGTEQWLDLKRLRDELELGLKQQTEPDVVLQFPSWGWVFIEAKLSSPTATYACKEARVAEWIKRYCPSASDVFDRDALARVEGRAFPEQILRNLVFAHRLARRGERAAVVALSRERDCAKTEALARDCLRENAPISFHTASWERLYHALPREDQRLDALRRYLEAKSVGLLRAFDL